MNLKLISVTLTLISVRTFQVRFFERLRSTKTVKRIYWKEFKWMKWKKMNVKHNYYVINMVIIKGINFVGLN